MSIHFIITGPNPDAFMDVDLYDWKRRMVELVFYAWKRRKHADP